MCGICGDTTQLTLCRYWSPDDGWIYGHLCASCHADCADRKPRPGDYAYDARTAAGSIDTDEDITDII